MNVEGEAVNRAGDTAATLGQIRKRTTKGNNVSFGEREERDAM
jgi:hypothetical protein